MYQLTDGTFAEAKHYCIHDHHVVEEGPGTIGIRAGSTVSTCVSFRVDAVEMTSAYLDRAVTATLLAITCGRPPAPEQDLAAVIHLCGAGAGDLYVRRGLRLTDGQKCGDHEARVYVGRVDAMECLFARLAAGG